MKQIDEVKRCIIELRPELIERVKKEVEDANNYRYETFGKEIEDIISKYLIKLLTEKGIFKDSNDYIVAKNKNAFPDMTINTNPPFALEYKAGNIREKKANGSWGKCNNSQNDLGTLNSWPSKLKRFEGDNIYFLFVEYQFDDETIKVIDIKIEPFYKIIGINSAGLLSYREKDGNLRPKDFNQESPIKTYKQFLDLIKSTNEYRSKRIITKHINNIPDNERNVFLDSLKIK